jgi:hypothetical protein
MRVWQQGMIVLARSQRVQLFMQDRSALTRLAERFVGGADAAEAVTKALELKKKGCGLPSIILVNMSVTHASSPIPLRP